MDWLRENKGRNQPYQSCSTISTLIVVGFLFSPDRRYLYESPAAVSPVQAKSGHEPTQGSMLWLTGGLKNSAAMPPVPVLVQYKEV